MLNQYMYACAYIQYFYETQIQTELYVTKCMLYVLFMSVKLDFTF